MKEIPKSCNARSKECEGIASASVLRHQELYKRSIDDADAFWSEQARRYLTWDKEWDFVLRFDQDEANVAWFGGGRLNASFNCLDRHLDTRKNTIAYLWEGDDPTESRAVTYGELHASVSRLSAVLKSRGVRKGDRVIIYLPVIVELAVAMLACARIGAVHCAVFSGLSGEALAARIRNLGARVVITADAGRKAGKIVPLKPNVDEAVARSGEVETVIVFSRCGLRLNLTPPREIWWHEAVADTALPEEIPPEPMEAEDPLFILFAGGAVGKPRALVHTHGGFLLWAAMTSHLTFDLREGTTSWCTSDLAWIRGHTMSVYGPLLNGVSVVLFEGEPSHPDYGRCWSIVEKYRVDVFATEPTTLRVLASEGSGQIDKHDLSSLKILGSSGEPLPPEIWSWYDHFVGHDRCPIIDSWWQTESGGPMLTPLPRVGPQKPGSVSFPFFGVEPLILDLDTGEATRFPNQEGVFFIGRPWPGMARTIFRDHATYREDYFGPVSGMFSTGDGARRDEDGFYWMTGRIDDVIKAAGHRIGAWEVESALIAHAAVSEATVVGYPHPIKGQGLYAFVTLNSGVSASDDLKAELSEFLNTKIGYTAIPDVIQWAGALPKTKGGKILRRLLQKIAAGRVDDLGDLTTVANPQAVEALIRDRTGLADSPTAPSAG